MSVELQTGRHRVSGPPPTQEVLAPVQAQPSRFRRTPEERFWEKVKKTDSCWLWIGSRSPRGYGRLLVDGRNRLAHRVAYVLLVGPIPDGLCLDHLCRNPGCVNPTHLEPVTHKENCLRAPEGPIVENAAKTHCAHGHPFDEANTYIYTNGHRGCRACGRERRRYRTKANGQPPPQLAKRPKDAA